LNKKDLKRISNSFCFEKSPHKFGDFSFKSYYLRGNRMIKKFAILCMALSFFTPAAFAADWIRINLTNTEKYIYLDHNSIYKNGSNVFYVVRYKNSKTDTERIAYVKYNIQNDKIGIMKIKDFEQDKYISPDKWSESYAMMKKVNEDSFFKNINNFVKDDTMVQKLVSTKQIREKSATTNNTDLINKYFAQNPGMKEYVVSVQKKIRENWVLPVTNNSGVAKVLFKIDRNGKLVSCEIKQSSGNKINDDSALNAVKNTAPFDKFPQTADKKHNEISIIMSFDYYVLDVNKK